MSLKCIGEHIWDLIKYIFWDVESDLLRSYAFSEFYLLVLLVPGWLMAA